MLKAVISFQAVISNRLIVFSTLQEIYMSIVCTIHMPQKAILRGSDTRGRFSVNLKKADIFVTSSLMSFLTDFPM